MKSFVAVLILSFAAALPVGLALGPQAETKRSTSSWLVVNKGEVLANQHGAEFHPHFPRLLKVHIEEMCRKGSVHGSLVVNMDGTTTLTLSAK